MDEDGVFHFGDGDLVFLGCAAVLAARHHMIRKGGQVPFQGFASPDQEALRSVAEGMMMGATMPLDEVPRIHMAAYADRRVLHNLVARFL